MVNILNVWRVNVRHVFSAAGYERLNSWLRSPLAYMAMQWWRRRDERWQTVLDECHHNWNAPSPTIDYFDGGWVSWSKPSLRIYENRHHQGDWVQQRGTVVQRRADSEKRALPDGALFTPGPETIGGHEVSELRGGTSVPRMSIARSRVAQTEVVRFNSELGRPARVALP